MNLLEHYIQPGYNVKPCPKDVCPIKDEDCVIFEGYVDCYGNIEKTKELWTVEEWQKIKKQGYYMA